MYMGFMPGEYPGHTRAGIPLFSSNVLVRFELLHGARSCIKILVWCMNFKKALNKEKNTPIVRKDENGLKLKLIITSFNIRLLTLRKSVAS